VKEYSLGEIGVFIRVVVGNRTSKMVNDVTLHWVANNADKKSLQKFIDGQYRDSNLPKPKPQTPPPAQVQTDWNRLALAFKSGALK